MTSLYLLESDPRARPARFHWLSHGFGDAVKISRGEWDPWHEIELTVAGAGSKRSVLWRDTGVFIGDGVRRLLEDASVSGWRAVRAVILTVATVCTRYSLPVTVGRRGRIAYDKSDDALIVRVPVRAPVHIYRRISVDLDGWDGSDIVVDAAGTTGIIGLSPKAAEVFRKANGAKPVKASDAMAFESVERS